jgi:hypothetical protein
MTFNTITQHKNIYPYIIQYNYFNNNDSQYNGILDRYIENGRRQHNNTKDNEIQ